MKTIGHREPNCSTLRFWIWTGSLFGLLVGDIAFGQACEQNVIVISTGCTPTPITSYASALDTAFCCPAFECSEVGGAAYDLQLAVVSAFAGGAGAQVTTRDAYQLIGLSGNDPVTLQAHLKVRGALLRGRDTHADMEVAIKEGVANESRLQIDPPLFGPGLVEVDTTLTITIQAIPNAVFTISMFLFARSPGDSYADFYPDAETPFNGGELSFTGLPPGSVLASCQGYRLEIPVTVRPTGWSNIKFREW